MGRPEPEINKQKFIGVMDTSSDMTVFKQGKHRSSYNLRAISSDENQFIFQSINGTVQRTSLKAGYKSVGWCQYEDSFYILSKPWTEPIKFLYLSQVDGYITITFTDDISSIFTVGENIFFKKLNTDDYNYSKSSGIFKIQAIFGNFTIQLDLLSKSYNESELGSGTGTGIVEKLIRGEIGEIKVDKSTGNMVYQPLYNHKNLKLSFYNYISREGITINKENNNTLRMYFTDYVSEPRSINLRKSIFKKHIENGQLVVSKHYMVIDGDITHNSVIYSTGSNTNNVFSAVSTGYTGTGTVIEYYPVEMLAWNPDYAPGTFEFIGSQFGGSIEVGTYSAVYRMTDSEGAKSPWSLPTNPIYLGKGVSLGTFQTYWEKQGSVAKENSNQSMIFEFKDLDIRWTKLQIAIIKHLDEDVFANPVLIYDEEISTSYFKFIYDGTTDTTSFDIGEINQFNRNFKKVMTIESIQNILFASNFESTSLLTTYKPGAVGVEFETYKCISDEVVMNELVSTGTDISAISPIYDTDSGIIDQPYPFPITGHRVNFDAGLFSGVWYQADDSTDIGLTTPITYKEQQIFQVDDSQIQRVVAGNATHNLRPVILIKRYINDTLINDTIDMVSGEVYEVVVGIVDVYETGDLFEYKGQVITFGAGTFVKHSNYKKYDNYGFLDGNNELVQEKLSSFPRSEKIRIGIIPVDKKGNKLPPRKIAEITTPEISASPLSGAKNMTSRSDAYVAWLNHLYLKVGTTANPIDISDIIDDISGFHIVIAPIQRKKKAQGLMFRTQRSSVDKPISVRCEWGIKLYNDYYRYYYQYNPGAGFPTTYPNGYPGAKVLFSPDVSLQDYEKIGIGINDQIKIEHYLTDNQAYILSQSFGIYDALYAIGNPYKVSGSEFTSSLSVKFQLPYIDQTTDKSALGSTIIIKDSLKVSEPGTYSLPNYPDVFYRTDALSKKLFSVPHGDAPGQSRNFRSEIYESLVLGHDQQEFGLLDDNITQGVLVSIVSSEEANYGSDEFSEYVSIGHYQPINDKVKQDTSGIFTGIEVFGGETFLSFYTQRKNRQAPTYGAINDDPNPIQIPGESLLITFPCESLINTYRRTYYHAAKDREQIDPVKPESFVVNKGDKYRGTLIDYAALINVDYESTLFEKSTAFSTTKIQSERYDSWREFLFGNYRTAESQLERIIASKRSDQYLILWHEKGLSYYPVNDRAVMTDNQGANLRIGYGGIMDTNISLSFTEGLQDRKALVETSNNFIWLCKRTKNILQIPKKGHPEFLNEKNFLDTFLGEYLADGNSILTEDNPHYGKGIVGGYNPKYKEVYFTFLADARGKREDVFSANQKFDTLVIDALNMVPTGKSKLIADEYMWIDTWLYSTLPMPPYISEKNYENKTFYYKNEIYIGLNSDSIYVGDQAILLNETLFKVIGNVGGFHQHNIGTKCMFYGVMSSPQFTAVFNMPVDLFKRFDANQLYSNHSPDVTSFKTNVGLSALETPAWNNRDYSWINSLPLTTLKERLRGHAVEITYIWKAQGDTIVTPGEKVDLLLRQIDLYFKFINQK